MPNRSKPLRPEWTSIPQDEFRALYRQLSSRDELASFWGIPLHQLNYLLYHPDKSAFYQKFSIPRNNGRYRNIEQPDKTLKYIQRIIHESLSRVYGPHPAVHGFVQNRSVVTNAMNHLGRQYVLNVDLRDFFPSITAMRIYGRLTKEPYSLTPVIASVITSLATNAYMQLPQGSPSSPVLANMLAAEMDTELAKLCGNLGCRYTRYADDITISTMRDEMPPSVARYPNSLGTGQVILGEALITIIKGQGFEINERKSRLQSFWTRQMCTGLVVNGKSPSPRRTYIRNLKSLIHHWEKNGWQDAAKALHKGDNRINLVSREQLSNHIIGKLGYMKMVRGKGDRIVSKLEGVVKSIPQTQ